MCVNERGRTTDESVLVTARGGWYHRRSYTHRPAQHALAQRRKWPILLSLRRRRFFVNEEIQPEI